jgi:Pyruvate/2-oxoacid:ferredoxin oxidoreductase delta subunit
MSISRKEFICRGIFAFGRELADSVRGESSSAADRLAEENQGYLLVDNSRCLAQKGGCFACMDHCSQGAISIVLGKGIAVRIEECTGCGFCADVCPVTPKVITMKQISGK